MRVAKLRAGQWHVARARPILPRPVLRETRAELATAREAGGGEGFPWALRDGPHPNPLPEDRERGEGRSDDVALKLRVGSRRTAFQSRVDRIPSSAGMIVFPCHVCRTDLSAEDHQAGQLVRCPSCLTTLRVPAGAGDAVAAAPAPYAMAGAGAATSPSSGAYGV